MKGRIRRLKWVILVLTLGIYYIAPFLRWDRGPGEPDQAILLDFEHGRLYGFFIEIWPQELYYVTGLMILAAAILILANALAGRVWCGFACPQTVWTDLFLLVERLDRRRPPRPPEKDECAADVAPDRRDRRQARHLAADLVR